MWIFSKAAGIEILLEECYLYLGIITCSIGREVKLGFLCYSPGYLYVPLKNISC